MKLEVLVFIGAIISRTPHGVRGLKCHQFDAHGSALLVAPLTGCVD